MTFPAGNGCHYPPPYTSPAPCKPLQSFDISYVDEATHTYLLADRSNAAIDVFDTLTNKFVKFLQPSQPFAGAQPSSVATGSGPNGVIFIPGVILNPPPTCTVGCFNGSDGKTVNMVWAGDAPSSGSTGTSSLKVMDLDSGATLAVLNTLGVRRSDELCFVTLPSGAPDPNNPYVLVANDVAGFDGFLTIWRWDNFQFVERINLTGNDPLAAPYNTAAGGTHNAANGIEQCKFNPRNKHFYLAIPATTGSTTDGFVLKISLPKQPSPWIPLTKCTPSPTNCEYAKVVAAYEIFPGATGCGVAGAGAGPAGLSIGPSLSGTNTNGLIALGCGTGSVGSLIIDDSANMILSVPLPKGTDETWYDPASNHFFFAQSGTGPASGWLGVVDANEYPPRSYLQEDGDTGGSPVQDTTAVAATGSHSVAVYPGACGTSPTPTRLSRVYLPFRSTLTTPNNGSLICSGFLGAFPLTGAAPQWPGGTAQAPTAADYDQWGCIAVYTAPATCSSTGHANPSP
jgi:hypothetical protein